MKKIAFFFKITSYNIGVLFLLFLILCLLFIFTDLVLENRDGLEYVLTYAVFLVMLFVIVPLLPFTLLWNVFFYWEKDIPINELKQILGYLASTIVVLLTMIYLFDLAPIYSNAKEWFFSIIIAGLLYISMVFYFRLLYKWVKPLY